MGTINPKDIVWNDELEHSTPATQESEELKTIQPGEAALRGFSNASTLGLGKYIQAPVNAIPGMPSNDPSKSYWDNIKNLTNQEVDANAQAQKDQPAAYFGGSAVGAAPMAALSTATPVGAYNGVKTAMAVGTAKLPQVAALGGAGAGLTTLADTQDPIQALKSAALGAAIPATLPLLGKVGGALKPSITNAATEKVAGQVEQLAKGGQSSGLVKSGVVVTPANADALALGGDAAKNAKAASTRPYELATSIREGGISTLNQPEWAGIKDLIQKQNPSGLIPALKGAAVETAKGGALGGGLGATVGMAPLGGALGSVAGVAKGAKNYATNKAIQQTLSPTAEAGKSKILEMAKKTTDPARWAAITNVMNQTDPESRAFLRGDTTENSPSKDQE